LYHASQTRDTRSEQADLFIPPFSPQQQHRQYAWNGDAGDQQHKLDHADGCIKAKAPIGPELTGIGKKFCQIIGTMNEEKQHKADQSRQIQRDDAKSF